MYTTQLDTQSPLHVIRQRAHRQRALSSLKIDRFGRSNYYSPHRLFFMSHYTIFRRRRSSEHCMACSCGNNLIPGDWESWRSRPPEAHAKVVVAGFDPFVEVYIRIASAHAAAASWRARDEPRSKLTSRYSKNNDTNRTKAPGQLSSVLSLESQMQPQKANLREVRDTPAQMRISGHQESGAGEATPQRAEATNIRLFF